MATSYQGFRGLYGPRSYRSRFLKPGFIACYLSKLRWDVNYFLQKKKKFLTMSGKFFAGRKLMSRKIKMPK